jgi:hypothetical protein
VEHAPAVGRRLDVLALPDTPEGQPARARAASVPLRLRDVLVGTLPHPDPRAATALGRVLDGVCEALEVAVETVGADAVREHLVKSLTATFSGAGGMTAPPERVPAGAVTTPPAPPKAARPKASRRRRGPGK